MEKILNPEPIGSLVDYAVPDKNGKNQSLFVAMDCEMDQVNDSNVVVKVSIVDESGRILLDTLVNPD